MLNVLLWYFWVQVFALGGSWVAKHWLGGLPDRGYGVGKALGLLLAGYFYWILVTLGLAQNNSGAVLMAVMTLLVIGYWLSSTQPITNNQSTNNPRRRIAIVVTELIFALGFVLCALYRAYTPDIMSAGGEKYMESMMLNAIVRSSHFPPNDAWLSGFSISYYYFGYVILAMLTKISGVLPSIAFNLGGATVFALALTSAFSVGFNLWALFEDKEKAEGKKQKSIVALSAGLLTALMLTVMGNLGGLMGVLRCGNVLPASVWQWLDVREIATQQTECVGLRPSGHFYAWWWDWSRVVKDYSPDGSVQEVITETPAFSYILGDNHPHTLALPFVLIAVAFALNAASQTFGLIGVQRPVRSGGMFFVGAIVLGGLAFLNTWDFPVYGAIAIGGVLLGCKLRGESPWRGLGYGVAILLVSYLLYLPFYVTFSSQARGIGVNLFNGTSFAQFALMFPAFVLVLIAYMLNEFSQIKVPMRMTLRHAATLTVGLITVALLAVVVFGLASPQNRALANELQTTGTVMGVSREAVNQRLLARLQSPWTILFLTLSIATCATLFFTQLTANPNPSSPHPLISPPPSPLIVLALFVFGAALTLVPEFIFLQDLFGTRMNTVFKFYYQAWTFWSVASAFAVIRLLSTPKLWARVMGGVVLFFVAAGMLYPALAAFSKTNNFSAQPTLDGAAYLQTANPDDAKAIDWLNKNVSGDPVVLERPDKGSYGYEGRIAAFTGLPTPLGWGGHQNQWRGNYDEPGRREPMIASLYNTTDEAEARNLLEQLNVSYVVIGSSERAAYTPDGLAKFANFCGKAFASGENDSNTTIYKCR